LLDIAAAGVQGGGMDEPTFDGFDVKFCRLIVEQLVGLREAIKIQAGLLKTLIERQDQIIEVLKEICDNVEGTDDPYGLFRDDEEGLSSPDP
jgi:hypothetical protein